MPTLSMSASGDKADIPEPLSAYSEAGEPKRKVVTRRTLAFLCAAAILPAGLAL